MEKRKEEERRDEVKSLYGKKGRIKRSFWDAKTVASGGEKIKRRKIKNFYFKKVQKKEHSSVKIEERDRDTVLWRRGERDREWERRMEKEKERERIIIEKE